MLKWLLVLTGVFLELNNPLFSEDRTEMIQKEQILQFYAYREQPDEAMYDDKCMPCTASTNDPGTIAFTKQWKIKAILGERSLFLSAILVLMKK